MSPDIEEFRQRLLTHAKLAVSRATRVDSEAKTNNYLVQPFLKELGYDPGNPDEVAPEHHADFSEKYQNKVDYAILHEGQPVIAIESKRVGAAIKDDRGQLRSYFNACQTVKLGILTDGLKFEFYADSDKPNMMDEGAFLRLDLKEIAKNNSVDDHTLRGLADVRRGFFSPENVGAEAKRKMLFESIVETIKTFKSEPPDESIRLVLSHSSVGSKIVKVTQKILDANREIVRSAMQVFVDQEGLAKFGYAPKDVVKAPTEQQDAPSAPAVPAESPPEVFQPSAAEQAVLSYAIKRLLFLSRNEILFSEAQKISSRKTKTSFRVFYERPNNGSLFDYKEHRDGSVTLQFPALEGKEVAPEPSAELDECLVRAFTRRVAEAGIAVDAAPVLHTIKGGHTSSAA